MGFWVFANQPTVQSASEGGSVAVAVAIRGDPHSKKFKETKYIKNKYLLNKHHYI